MSNVVTQEDRGIFSGKYGEVMEHKAEYDFPISEQPIATNSGIVIPDRRAIVRTDTNQILGMVGSNYKVLSHKDALEPIIDGLQNRGFETFQRTTLTQNGARMFANIYFPNKEREIKIGKSNDTYWPGISIVNSLDGTLKYHLEASIYRLICTNGMRVPTVIAGGASVHSKNKDFESMIDQILTQITADGNHFSTFQNWANIPVKRAEIADKVEGLFKTKKFTYPERYKDIVLEEIAREEKFGMVTVWNLYNAFNSVLEHHLIREKGRYDRARLLDQNMFEVFATKFGK